MLAEKLGAQKGDESCYRILSASQFLRLKQFNIVDGFLMDYMHTVLLGVMRTYTTMVLDSKNHAKTFYIGDKQSSMNAVFVKCKVPFEVNRTTTDLKKWLHGRQMSGRHG